MNKVVDLLKSRRFWAAVISLLVIIMSDVFGVELETADLMALVTIVLGWIGADTVRPAGAERLEIKTKKE